MIVKVTGAGPYTATFPAGLADSTSVLVWNATSDSLTVAGASAAYKVGPGSAAPYVESPSGVDVWERLPGGGTSGGTAYDQDLNTTDNVTFNSVTASNAVTANDVQVNDLLEVVGSSSFDTVAEFNDGLAVTAEGATIAGGLTVSEGNVTTTGQYLTANGQALTLVDSLASADVLTDLGYAQATKIIGVDSMAINLGVSGVFRFAGDLIGAADLTAPTIGSFDASQSGANVAVSFTTDETLALIRITGQAGADLTFEEVGLTEDDCTPLTAGTVTCTHPTPSLKLWTYTLDSAEDAAGNDGAAGESDTLTVTADAGLTTTAEHYAATNPVAYYEYEEGSGTTWVDETGANSGTYVGAVQWTYSDTWGSGAARLATGMAAYVPKASADAFDLSGAFSCEAWVDPVSSGTGNFCSRRNDSTGGFRVIVTSTGAVTISTFGSGPATATTTATPFSDSAWGQLVVTYSGTGSDFLVYKDGALVETLAVGDPGSIAASGSVFTGPGGVDGTGDIVNTTTTNYFSRLVFYDYVLDAGQVDANWDAGRETAFAGCVNSGGANDARPPRSAASSPPCTPPRSRRRT